MTATLAPRPPAALNPTRPDQRPQHNRRTPPDLRLRLRRPTSTSVLIHVSGDVDAHSSPRLRELISQRLASVAETLVLDLTDVSFLGVDGLELLVQAQQRAESRAVVLRLVTGPVSVRRALAAAGLTNEFATFPTLRAATSDLSGRTREL
jgi:anti-sigma B factor antagonist